MLTSKTKYGLKALVVLGRMYASGRVISIGEIAERENIPLKFLETILVELKNRSILRSKRGPGGGYMLAEDPEVISLADVIRWLNGPLALVPCASEFAYQPCEECNNEETCGIRLVMKEVRAATVKVLQTKTLGELVRRSNEASGYEDAPMYYI
ncbi:MAG: Rrf2 family transcriptional regulator [Candidatus Hydrogenedentes bacterium]|nr:Rrf2 family transcriptional regulator [Candidatus Hydrogenedentota bacterium]